MLYLVKRYQFIVISITLALLSLRMVVTNVKDDGSSLIIGKVISSLTVPFQKAITYTIEGTRDIWTGYIHLVGIKEENERLKEALAHLREENHRLREVSLSNERLRELLNFKEATPLSFKGAEVIGIESIGWFRTATLDKGIEDGVLKDMAVVTSQGIVGRTIETHRGTSKVLLVTDPRSNIDAIIERTRAKGIIGGGGTDRLILKYIQQIEDIQVGDIVITSGLGGVFPKGLLIGDVVKVEMGDEGFFKLVEVRPSVDLKRLEEVLVITESPQSPI